MEKHLFIRCIFFFFNILFLPIIKNVDKKRFYSYNKTLKLNNKIVLIQNLMMKNISKSYKLKIIEYKIIVFVLNMLDKIRKNL